MLFIFALLSADFAVGQIITSDAVPEPVNVKKQKRMAVNDKRFPKEKEWQNSFFFCSGKTGEYDLKSFSFDYISPGAYAWDFGYIGGGLFRKSFFLGLGTGVSGYHSKYSHKMDIIMPFFIHLKWYMLGNSTVSPYIATSQGLDLYFVCRDYKNYSDLELGLHSKYNIGLHFRPKKNSKFGITTAFEFGIVPYRVTESHRYKYEFSYHTSAYGGSSWVENVSIYRQEITQKMYNTALYLGANLALTF